MSLCRTDLRVPPTSSDGLGGAAYLTRTDSDALQIFTTVIVTRLPTSRRAAARSG